VSRQAVNASVLRSDNTNGTSLRTNLCLLKDLRLKSRGKSLFHNDMIFNQTA